MLYVMNNEGYILKLHQFFQDALNYNVIFIGEVHDSPEAHEAQFIILTGLFERNPKVVLALEMFERDVQEVLDNYLSGAVSENEFLEASRPWPNYKEDYRPLIEFARVNRIPVVAANVPRRAAAAVAKADEVSPAVVSPDHIYLPEILHYNSEEYYERFAATMHHMPHASPMSSISVDGLYKAQILKDAVMASSLEPYLDRLILFCCGRFHSDYHLGIPYQLAGNHPELRVAVMTFASYIEDLPMSERSGVADFIWIKEEE